MQPLQNCIGPTIRIGREILCLPYAGFFTLGFSLTTYSLGWCSVQRTSKYLNMPE